jgi:hypothetical protein
MFTKRPSDQGWIKYLLSTGLLAVDQLEKMRGNQNQIDVGELLFRHAQSFDRDTWLNQALQQDRFHYIPVENLDGRELTELQQLQPALISRCLGEGILPLGFSSQTLYLGLLRYDAEFPELTEILESVPAELRVCLVPIAPADYSALHRRAREAANQFSAT